MCRSATSELVKMYFKIQSLKIKPYSSAKEEVDECLGNVVKSLEEAENVKEVRHHIQLGGETYHRQFLRFSICKLSLLCSWCHILPYVVGHIFMLSFKVSDFWPCFANVI